MVEHVFSLTFYLLIQCPCIVDRANAHTEPSNTQALQVVPFGDQCCLLQNIAHFSQQLASPIYMLHLYRSHCLFDFPFPHKIEVHQCVSRTLLIQPYSYSGQQGLCHFLGNDPGLESGISESLGVINPA